MAKKQKNPWKFIIGVLIVLFLASFILSGFVSLFVDVDMGGNVAQIPIKGVILTGDSRAFLGSGVAESGAIVELIEKAADNPSIQAIILEIDSPGGAPVATDEISVALEKANKTTVAWIREVGASGGYWIASATDHVIANRMSITGSIGVMGSYLDFSGLLHDYNITYERLNAGKYKDLGVPFRQLEPQERVLLQKKINLIHQEFKDVVQANRKLTNAEITVVSTGEFYLGREAFDLGLVDELGGKGEAVDYIEKKLNITVDIAVYEQKESFFDKLAGVFNRQSFGLNQNVLLR
ncbi:signal peptide peptidase SppA [Candidatus Woesearchaeota archaeon]|nr:signal peptide peptidase SppA [Candidatus Woesearchaeota archaeon]